MAFFNFSETGNPVFEVFSLNVEKRLHAIKIEAIKNEQVENKKIECDKAEFKDRPVYPLFKFAGVSLLPQKFGPINIPNPQFKPKSCFTLGCVFPHN